MIELSRFEYEAVWPGEDETTKSCEAIDLDDDNSDWDGVSNIFFKPEIGVVTYEMHGQKFMIPIGRVLEMVVK